MGFIQDFPNLKDDGLSTPEVGAWGQQKYRLVDLYSQLFSKSMKSKWDSIVYIDLFSGSGRSKIRDSARIIASSPMLALEIEPKFDHYIFCEKDSAKSAALKTRVKREFPHVNVSVINGDSNKCTDKILSEMPTHNRNFKVLSFCFVDPFKIANLSFTTIEKLAKRFVDFLVLIPSGMDANRNLSYYLQSDNTNIDNFLGNNSWREDWQNRKNNKSFEEFIVDQFNKSMKRLNYHDPGLNNCCPIRSHDKNLLLYRLALYSRHKLGNKFWEATKKYSDPQIKMFE